MIELVCYEDGQGALVIGKKRRMWILSSGYKARL